MDRSRKRVRKRIKKRTVKNLSVLERLELIWNYEGRKDGSSLRKKTFKALGVFFLLMLLFTLLSRAANTFTMSEVVVDTSQRRSIDHFVRQEGTIEVDEVRGIFVLGGLNIGGVSVAVGNTVEVGTPLITVDMNHLNEKIAEMETQLEIADLLIADAVQNQSLTNQQRHTEQTRAQEDYSRLQSVQNSQVSEAFLLMENARAALDDFLNQPITINPPSINDNEESTNTSQESIDGSQDSSDNIGNNESENRQETERMLREVYEAARIAYEKALQQRDGQLVEGYRRIQDANLPLGQNSSIEIAKLERETLENTLEAYIRLQENDGIITSPMDGIIVSLDAGVVVGGITPQTAMMQIADGDAGYIFVAIIPREEQRHISEGDTVTLEPMRGERIPNLTVETITRNQQDDEKMDIRVRVPAHEDIRLYDMATMIVEGESRIFSTTIPLSALHKGGVGEPDFILLVREENTILGSQLVVDRLPVTVQDKNDSFVAIGDHELSSEQQFIVFSENEVRAGDRVLMPGE